MKLEVSISASNKMQSNTTNIVKKYSPSKDIIFYIAQRDFVDHYKQIDPIDGLIIIPYGKSHGRRLFVELQCHFRYSSEAEEFTDIPFKKTVTIAYCELFPFSKRDEKPALKYWQAALMKKWENDSAICPFTLEFPQGSAPSLVAANPNGVKGEPCGLTYQVIAYLCTEPSLPLQKRDVAALKIRVLQEQLLPQAIEQLALAPTARPATLVCRKFFISPGKMQIEMCLDKAIYYLGDKLVMSVIINNSSNRTIRKIKCKLYQVSQVSFAPGLRRVPIYVHETVDGCPIQPGATLQRSYTMMTKLQPHLSSENMIFEASTNRNEEFTRMASTTIFPYTDPKEGFAILVSYEAKIKVYLGSVHVQGLNDVSATVPFFLFHPPSNKVSSSEPDIIPSVMINKPPRNPRMIRFTSVEMDNFNTSLDEPQEPLLCL